MTSDVGIRRKNIKFNCSGRKLTFSSSFHLKKMRLGIEACKEIQFSDNVKFINY